MAGTSRPRSLRVYSSGLRKCKLLQNCIVPTTSSVCNGFRFGWQRSPLATFSLEVSGLSPSKVKWPSDGFLCRLTGRPGPKHHVHNELRLTLYAGQETHRHSSSVFRHEYSTIC